MSEAPGRAKEKYSAIPQEESQTAISELETHTGVRRDPATAASLNTTGQHSRLTPQLLPSTHADIVQEDDQPVFDVLSTTIPTTNNEKTGMQRPVAASGACNNCKRAHLGCDSNRPCSRCTVGGKQDSCADVPQKKRGRPRLRGESSASASTLALEMQNTNVGERRQSETQAVQSSGSIRRRADSTRSVQSLESSSFSFSTGSPMLSREPPASLAARTSDLQPLLFPVDATAKLDLDLNFIKVDDGLHRIFANLFARQPVRLLDIAQPVIPNVFHHIRTKMRDEREAKHPSYLAPIVTTREDLPDSMSSVDLTIATRGFDVLYYQLDYSLSDGGIRRFWTKFCLARTTRFFVVMTLLPNPVDYRRADETGSHELTETRRATAGQSRVPQSRIWPSNDQMIAPSLPLSANPNTVLQSRASEMNDIREPTDNIYATRVVATTNPLPPYDRPQTQGRLRQLAPNIAHGPRSEPPAPLSSGTISRTISENRRMWSPPTAATSSNQTEQAYAVSQTEQIPNEAVAQAVINPSIQPTSQSARKRQSISLEDSAIASRALAGGPDEVPKRRRKMTIEHLLQE